MTLYTALSTFPDQETARHVSRVLVEKQLVACVNLVPGVESIYQWEGKVCQEQEVLAIIKTHEHKLPELKQTLIELHPYDVPELILFEIKDGHEAYLQWLAKLP